MLINRAILYQKRPYTPYVAPFAIFAVCIYVGALFNIPQGILYPIKAVLVSIQSIPNRMLRGG
jgi:hypothetical protein